jgi:DNA-binding transcriptional MerR regulator
MCSAASNAFRPATMNETQTITELARDFGLTTRAIRYWESHGLVSPAREGGNRIYSKRDQTRLKLALRGKRLGLSLAEIKELIDMYDTVEDESTQLQSFLEVLAQRRAALEQQRDDIQAVLKEIARFERQCREMLKADQPPAPSVRQPKRRATGFG